MNAFKYAASLFLFGQLSITQAGVQISDNAFPIFSQKISPPHLEHVIEPAQKRIFQEAGIHLQEVQKASIGYEEFLRWIDEWFLPGKYVQYLTPKFIYQLAGGTNAPQKPKKQASKKSTDRVHKKSKSPKHTPVTTSQMIYMANSPQLVEVVSSLSQKLKVSPDDITANQCPANFPSTWVWNVIGWIDGALKKNKKSRTPKKSFHDALAASDPALPEIVKATLRVVFFSELSSPQGEFITNNDKRLVISWLDYMLSFYDCSFSWRDWLFKDQVQIKGGLLQSLTKPLPEYDSSLQGKRTVASRLGISKKIMHSNRKPHQFRSNGLWVVLTEFYSKHLTFFYSHTFTGVFHGDPVFANALQAIIFNVFSTPTGLMDDERYLFEYWLDSAVAYLHRSLGLNLEWRKLMKPVPANPDILAFLEADVSGQNTGSEDPDNTSEDHKPPPCRRTAFYAALIRIKDYADLGINEKPTR